jgi:hypothetical protein
MPASIRPLIPAFSRRILSRLAAAETLEPDLWLRDDLEIARLTVLYAARGEAVECSPHVLASYMYLGLHPEKVWPAIQARRKALLGPLLEQACEVWSAPPKKPAQSVKLWCEQNNGARAVNSRAHEMVLRGPRLLPMATASIAAAYPNSDDSGSAKERPYFTVADIEEFFRTCPVELVPHRCLRTVQGMFIALEKRLGKKLHGDTFEFFLSHEDYRDGCRYKSDRTLRNNLPLAVKLGVLEVVHRRDDGQSHHIWIRPRTKRDKGEYRWATTYRLPVSLLMKWRELHRRGERADVTPFRKPSQPAPPPQAPAPAAPLPGKKVAEHRSNQRQSNSRKLTPREGPKLVNEMRRLMQGVKGHVGQDRLWIEYPPGDPRYRAPMSQGNALIAACMSLAIPEESAREFLKLLPRDLAESDEEQGLS